MSISRALALMVALFVVAHGTVAGEVTLCADSPSFLGFNTTGPVEIAAQCAFVAPESGSLLLLASTGVNEVNGWYTVRLRLAVDHPAGPGLVGSTRVIDALEGTLTRQTSQASVAVPVAAGTHTAYYLADRTVGTGTVQLYRPRLLAVFVPSSSLNLRLAGGFTNGAWTTTSSSLGQVTHCSLGGTGLGSALITADGHVDLADFAVEGRFGLGVNSASVVEAGTARRVDVASDLLYDGTDTSLATSRLASLGPSTWTFSLLGARNSGGGLLLVASGNGSIVLRGPCARDGDQAEGRRGRDDVPGGLRGPGGNCLSAQEPSQCTAAARVHPGARTRGRHGAGAR